MLALALTIMMKGGNHSHQWNWTILSFIFFRLKAVFVFALLASLTGSVLAQDPIYSASVVDSNGLTFSPDGQKTLTGNVGSNYLWSTGATHQTIANQSTFIRRGKYERGVNDFDPDNPNGEVVNSPKKTIEVEPHAGEGN